MKKKVPKFLIGKNVAAKPDATYVVHTQHPPFVGEILKFDSLLERNQFLEDNSQREVIQITPTTVLIVENYFTPSVSISDHKYLENKIVHWVIANYLNASAF